MAVIRDAGPAGPASLAAPLAGLVLIASGAALRFAGASKAIFALVFLGVACIYSAVHDLRAEMPAVGGWLVDVAPASVMLVLCALVCGVLDRRPLVPESRRLLRGTAAVAALLLAMGAVAAPVLASHYREEIAGVLLALVARAAELAFLVVFAARLARNLEETDWRRRLFGFTLGVALAVPGHDPDVKKPRIRAGRGRAAPTPPAAEPGPPKPSGWKLDLTLAVALLAAVPFSFRVAAEAPARSLFELKLPLVDLMVWLVILVEIVRLLPHLRVARRDGRTLARVREAYAIARPEFLLFVGVGAVSLAASAGALSGWKDLIQLVDTFLLAYWVFRRVPPVARVHRVLGFGLATVFAAMTLAAVAQVFGGTPAYGVHSLFPDRQSFLAGVVLLGPLVFCALQLSRRRVLEMAAYPLVGLASVVSGTLVVPVLMLGQLAAAAVLSRAGRLRVLAPIAAIMALSFAVLPRGYRRDLLKEPGAWLSVSLEQRRAEVRTTLRTTRPQVHFGLGSGHLFVGTSLGDWAHAPSRPDRTGAESRAVRVPPEYFAESWSALRLISTASPLGTGAGSWQRTIGTGFGVMERTGTSFPNTYNGYLLIGVTMGLTGLLAWLVCLGAAVGRVRRTALGARSENHRWIAAGCAGGLLGSALIILVCPVPTLPLGVYWVLLVSLSDGCRRGVERTA